MIERLNFKHNFMVHNFKNEETKLQTKHIVYNWGKFWTVRKKILFVST